MIFQWVNTYAEIKCRHHNSYEFDNFGQNECHYLTKLRSHLKIRIFVRDLLPRSAGQEREAKDQPAGILRYVEDLRRGLNADIGRKDFFEMTYRKT